MSKAHVLLAEVRKHMVGSVIEICDDWRGNINRLVLHPAFQRRGVARALVVEVGKRLAQQGARRITTRVEKDHPWATGFGEAVK